jgi:hypothetical protein
MECKHNNMLMLQGLVQQMLMYSNFETVLQYIIFFLLDH